jgi:hypothetical protein
MEQMSFAPLISCASIVPKLAAAPSAVEDVVLFVLPGLAFAAEVIAPKVERDLYSVPQPHAEPC